MKHLALLLILNLGLWSCNATTKQNDPEPLNERASNSLDEAISKTDDVIEIRDSVKYQISLNKQIYSLGEPIRVTLIAKNISEKDIKLWIDAGDYPTGSELNLLDSMGESIVRNHWAVMSSQSYTREEVKEFMTTIPIEGEFKKEYSLFSIVQLKKVLTYGSYELNYNNSEPVKFEIK
tara:strand:- start:54 stop:587 length:534 start_codon:yes stop_codon:yes gene_type:complete